MLNDEIRKRVEKATVRLTKKGGLGVIVSSNLILTAAHCIGWSAEGYMVLGDHFLEQVEIDGRQIIAAVCAVEPVLDIAALDEPDGQTFYDESNDYLSALESIIPIEINSEVFALFHYIPAFIFTHKQTWLKVNVQQCRFAAPGLSVCGAPIEGGTSGGPVVDQEGRLLGIVSCGGFTAPDYSGFIPRPHLSLPVWIMERIFKGGQR
ncbi:MAG: serine protease [Proteobacteria bacterium]|nr:serine protease [Pseudomonadota bacterium]